MDQSAAELHRKFFEALENTKDAYGAFWKHTQSRNEQLDALTVHLLAVCFGDILERSEEKHVEVKLPFKIQGIIVIHLAELLASRGFVVFGHSEQENEWKQATLAHMKHGDPISFIAVRVQENGNFDVEAENNEEKDRVQELERELLLAKEKMSRTKRKREVLRINEEVSQSMRQQEEMNAQIYKAKRFMPYDGSKK